MSVWYCVPSARPDGGTLPMWHGRGYKIAVWRDPGAPDIDADLTIEESYKGYAVAVNRLVKEALRVDSACQWVVTGGDDVQPDPTHSPEEIAKQLSQYFDYLPTGARSSGKCTYGVMQPTWDDWSDSSGRIIERIAGSPWMGREFCRRMYGGNGPLWHGWWHNWVDEELKCVAESMGVYWMRRDITHYHDHALRKPGGQWPSHLKGASADYMKMAPVFRQRKAAGFPGHEPLP